MPAPKKPVTIPALQPVEWTNADANAAQAMERGDATAEQQRRFMAWLLHSAAGLNEVSYRPGGLEGDRDTAFAEGRRFVALQVRKLLLVNLAKIQERENAER